MARLARATHFAEMTRRHRCKRAPFLAVLALALCSPLSASLLSASPLAAASPLGAQSVPTPESALGYRPGADFELASYEESIAYFERLAASSDRITLMQTGRTSEGRDWYIALISSAENLASLEQHKDVANRLAHPATLTDEEARALATSGRAIVDINGGLHASEVAGAQHTIQLAYDLVTGEDTRTRAIRDNVITVLWPSLNPDGQTLIADWYRSNVGTPYEVAPMPWLYQKYVGHDNNRDAYMLNMVESRVLARTWREWEPQIIYVHHQSSPFPTRIWLPPFAEPIATQAPPIMSRQVNTIGMAIAQLLESEGKPGSTHMGTGFDAWYPGYVDYMPMLQNQVAYWTETGLYRYATPHFYTIADFPASRRDLRAESLYSSPWEGGWWRLGDAVDYMLTASIATLDYAAKYREDLLYNRYQSGRDVIRKYTERPPYAYFVPQDQRDPVAAVELLRRLAFNGVRVYQLTSDVTHEGLGHPVGTWVIPMDQEFAELVRQVLDVQEYPDLREYPQGPPEQPYDAAGWTLPYQMDVRVVRATAPLGTDIRGALRAVSGSATPWESDVADATSFDSPFGVGFDSNPVAAAIVPPAGTITGSGSALALDPAQNNTFRALNRAWELGGTVRMDASGGGRYWVSGLSGSQAQALVDDLALQAARGSATGPTLRRPRVGLYRPWNASMDEGWTRWLLERYDFEFQNLRNSDVHAGDLRDRYDVIVLPAERPGALKDGHAEGAVPARYAGGLGDVGIRALDAFVRAGGTLVAMNQASDLAIDELHLPVQNVVSELGRQEFFSSGSIMEVESDVAHPVMAGMPELAKIFFDRSPVFTVEQGFEGSALLKYQEAGSPLLSGYLLGEEHVQGYAAALDVRYGEGRVVLLGFRPQWRGQPFGTFRALFNSVLFAEDVAEEASGSDGFWVAPEEPEDGVEPPGASPRIGGI